jgi:hypothetical protein
LNNVNVGKVFANVSDGYLEFRRATITQSLDFITNTGHLVVDSSSSVKYSSTVTDEFSQCLVSVFTQCDSTYLFGLILNLCRSVNCSTKLLQAGLASANSFVPISMNCSGACFANIYALENPAAKTELQIFNSPIVPSNVTRPAASFSAFDKQRIKVNANQC